MTLTTKTRLVADYVSGIELIDYDLTDIERDIEAGLWDWLLASLSYRARLAAQLTRAGRVVATVFQRGAHG